VRKAYAEFHGVGSDGLLCDEVEDGRGLVHHRGRPRPHSPLQLPGGRVSRRIGDFSGIFSGFVRSELGFREAHSELHGQSGMGVPGRLEMLTPLRSYVKIFND
jgi:hypothetical protein